MTPFTALCRRKGRRLRAIHPAEIRIGHHGGGWAALVMPVGIRGWRIVNDPHKSCLSDITMNVRQPPFFSQNIRLNSRKSMLYIYL